MPKLQMPYQCLQRCGNILIAARGSSIDSFSLEDRSLLSSWKCPTAFQDLKINDATKTALADAAKEHPPSPTKKRKLSAANHSQKSVASPGTKKANNRADAVASGLEAPAVIALAGTGDEHVVAVMGEDKTIRVFENAVKADGKQYLKHINQRAMPKRPCSLRVHNSTIISADKFGDVYSLPLLCEENGAQSSSPASSSTLESNRKTTFLPSANTLTVHSQRNLKALENQKRQTNKPSEKANPLFEHKLLLGHVSMLIDVVLAELDGQKYIITADRDEHIRVSRGIPQSHIIEGFCLGHTEFVSRLCVPKERPGLLISGGGDDELHLWQWATGSLLSKTDLKSHVARLAKTNGKISSGSAESDAPDATAPLKIAVSAILHLRLPGDDDMVIVTCEGIPALFTFILTPEIALQHIQTYDLPGNALSVISSDHGLIVSVDNIHAPGSTTEFRDPSLDDTESFPIQSYVFEKKLLVKKEPFAVVDGEEVPGENGLGRLTNLLYGLENLRKRDDGREEE